MKKHTANVVIAIIGGLLLVFGIYSIDAIQDTEVAILAAMPYISIGFGCGIFAHGVGMISMNGKKAPAKKNNSDDIMEIILIDDTIEVGAEEQKVIYAEKAKARAYDFMTILFGGLMVVFALMEVELKVLVAFAAAYILVQGYSLIAGARCKKELKKRIEEEY